MPTSPRTSFIDDPHLLADPHPKGRVRSWDPFADPDPKSFGGTPKPRASRRVKQAVSPIARAIRLRPQIRSERILCQGTFWLNRGPPPIHKPGGVENHGPPLSKKGEGVRDPPLGFQKVPSRGDVP